MLNFHLTSFDIVYLKSWNIQIVWAYGQTIALKVSTGTTDYDHASKSLVRIYRVMYLSNYTPPLTFCSLPCQVWLQSRVTRIDPGTKFFLLLVSWISPVDSTSSSRMLSGLIRDLLAVESCLECT